MKRISIHLPEEMIERLTKHSEETGIPQAEIVRQGLEIRLNQMDEEAFHKAEYRINQPDRR